LTICQTNKFEILNLSFKILRYSLQVLYPNIFVWEKYLEKEDIFQDIIVYTNTFTNCINSMHISDINKEVIISMLKDFLDELEKITINSTQRNWSGAKQ